MEHGQKIVIVGAGPVGSLAALYAANRGHDVEIYELRSGQSMILWSFVPLMRSHSRGRQWMAADVPSLECRPSGPKHNTSQLHQVHQPCPLGTRHQCHAPCRPAKTPQPCHGRNNPHARAHDPRKTRKRPTLRRRSRLRCSWEGKSRFTRW